MIEKPTEDRHDLRLPILSTDVLIQIQSFLDPKDILSLRKVLIVTWTFEIHNNLHLWDIQSVICSFEVTHSMDQRIATSMLYGWH